MADFTDREMIPTKEGSSFIETCRCSVIDRRERHVVCKLDRYELEDRYLRVLEEVQALKKLSNNQEDKIKRLATKLMRFGANPRACIAAIDLTNDQDKLSLLEAENSKLRDKICILRNQLISNKIFGRSPSRARKLPIGSNSSPATCRSESSRLKTPSCQCVTEPRNDENDLQNYSLKIEKMETEKKDMLSRIAELELELASFTSGNRREKVAENVEYIRVWRQMKQQSEKLVVAQNANEILNKQIHKLKTLLEETYKNNKQVNEALAAERKQVAQLDESMVKIKQSQIELREKDEKIMDLMNEIEIFQQHNRELLDLSTKFSKVEQENVECKRQIVQHLAKHEALKDALNKEKANTSALQAANEQLLTKLDELQKNIDLMSIQLMVQSDASNKTSSKKTSKRVSDISSSEEKSTLNKDLSKDNIDTCKKCCDDLKNKKIVHRHEKSIQTNERLELINRTTQTDKLLECAKIKENDFNEKLDKHKSEVQVARNGNSLSREGMLKLLEQVQISTPLESQNATRIRHAEVSSLPARHSRQVSNLETLLFGDLAF